MAFNKYDTVLSLNDSKEEWIIRVRAQIMWKGISRQGDVFRGYNIIFCDDSSQRIHAFIPSNLAEPYEAELVEGQIYTVQSFKVKVYNGDETNRAIRTDKHIFFTKDTELKVAENNGLKIPLFSFDFFSLSDMEGMKNDNRFLTDVVAVIQDVQPKAEYKNNGVDKSHVLFTITDGKNTLNVTFFNELGDSFLKANEKVVDNPVIIIIASAKCSDWKGALYLTNFPATRFYLNVEHHSVRTLRQRLTDPNFYVMDFGDEEEHSKIPMLKVTELRKLNEDYIDKQVLCQMTVKKIEEKMNWYIPICTNCDIELQYSNNKYQCSNQGCGRTYPYPDRRFQLYTLCGDATGNIPVVWPNDEICRITGQTVYDVEVDDDQLGKANVFPSMLKFCAKKTYNFTIKVTKENIKEASNIYKASHISQPIEMSDKHSPLNMKTVTVHPTAMSMEISTDDSPPTAQSSTKIRPRINVVLDKEIPQTTDHIDKIQKIRNIKKEKI